MRNFGVVGYLLPVIAGLAVAAAAAAFVVSRVNRPGSWAKQIWSGITSWRIR
jgi:hypothetical protein